MHQNLGIETHYYERDIVIAVSQSGETADTLSAIKLAKAKGATIFGICNVVGSSIARESHVGAYTHAGPEIGVASTKAFTAQVTIFILIALSLAEKRVQYLKNYTESCLGSWMQFLQKLSKHLN